MGVKTFTMTKEVMNTLPRGKYLYLRNGSVWTGDAANPKVESLIIGDGKIIALGK